MKRTKLASSLLLTAFASFFAVPGCNTSTSLQPVPQSDETGGDSSNGGQAGVDTSGTGGTAAVNVGGGTHTGGTPGVVATGGTPGVTATGGKAATPTGGTPGVIATGGTPGVIATGGTPGVIATGGAPVVTATGGAPDVVATGGSPVIAATGGAAAKGNTVTIANGKGLGAMTGWGFAAVGATDALTDPTCGTAKTAIPPKPGCATTTNWSSTTALCMSGTVPIVDAAYLSWGANIGLSSSETPGVGLGQTFSSVTLNVTGAPLTGLRAIVTVGGVDYCAVLTPGIAMPLSTFNTTCWDNKGTAPAGSTGITQIQVQVPAGAAAITVTNLCLNGITFS